MKRQETVSDVTAQSGHQLRANRDVPSAPQDFPVSVKPGYIPRMVPSLHFKEFTEGGEQEKHRGLAPLPPEVSSFAKMS